MNCGGGQDVVSVDQDAKILVLAAQLKIRIDMIEARLGLVSGRNIHSKMLRGDGRPASRIHLFHLKTMWTGVSCFASEWVEMFIERG
jgi:hypothetical protein